MIKKLLVIILTMMLTSCGGNIPNSMYEYKPPVTLGKPAVVKPEPGVAVLLDEPTATDVESTATLEPTGTEEVTGTEEPSATEEFTETDAPPIETGEVSTIDPYVTEEPIEGFWLTGDGSGHCSANIPKDWEWTEEYNPPPYDKDGNEGLYQFRLSSPDQLVYIYFLNYEDRGRTVWDQAFVRETVELLLNQIYSPDAKDVKVINYKLMPDGSEQATWVSRTCLCTGIVAHKLYETPLGIMELSVFAISYEISAKDQYLDLVHYIVGTLHFWNE